MAYPIAIKMARPRRLRIWEPLEASKAYLISWEGARTLSGAWILALLVTSQGGSYQAAAALAGAATLFATTFKLYGWPVVVAWGTIYGTGIATSFLLPVHAANTSALFLALPIAALAFTRIRISHILLCLVPFALAQGGFMFWEFIFNGGGRVAGLTANPNIAGGFLVMMLVPVMARRLPWPLASFIYAAIFLTGSRLGVLVGGWCILGIMLALRDPRKFIYILLGTALLLAPIKGQIIQGLRLDSPLLADITYRITQIGGDKPVMSPPLTLLPWESGMRLLGGTGVTAGRVPHSVPLRLAREWGLVAAIAWTGITAYALLRRRRFTESWWLVAVLALLSMLDHYLLSPVMVGFWWLALRERAEEYAARCPSHSLSCRMR